MTQKYVRKPFFVDALQVSEENIEAAAKWCNGEIRTEVTDEKYIKVWVFRALNERQTKAYIGDWLLYAGTGFKVYTTKAFERNFELVVSEGEGVVPVPTASADYGVSVGTETERFPVSDSD